MRVTRREHSEHWKGLREISIGTLDTRDVYNEALVQESEELKKSSLLCLLFLDFLRGFTRFV